MNIVWSRENCGESRLWLPNSLNPCAAGEEEVESKGKG